MPRSQRLTVSLPDAIVERISFIQELSGLPTQAAVLRRALALFDMIIIATKIEGSTLILEDIDGEQTRLLVVD